jgi:RNA polymerase sigma-70 factor (ECF subfamily)
VNGEESDEAALVARVQEGDPSAFDVLVRRHMRRAFAVAFRVLGQREDAEDLVQEAFMTALDKIGTFELGRPFAPWLMRIVVNRALNARKSIALRRMHDVPADAMAGDLPPDVAAEQRETHERLRRALDALPERQRLIIQLFELEGYTAPEIGEMLELSPVTVRWHAHEARLALRRTLGAPGGATPNESTTARRRGRTQEP